MSSRVNLAMQMGDGQRALKYALAEVELERQRGSEDNTNYAASVMHLGLAQMLSEQYAAAVQSLRQSLALWGKFDSTKTFLYAVIEDFLGNALVEQGNLTNALSHTEHAFDVFSSLNMPLYAQAAQFRLARIYLGNRQPERAETILRQLVAVKVDDLGSRNRRHNASNILACVLMARQADAEALPLVEECLKLREDILSNSDDFNSDRLEATWRSKGRVILDRYAVLASRGAVTADMVYDHVLRWKGSLYARQRRLRSLRSEPQAAPLLARWGSLNGALATLSLRTPFPEERAVWNARLTTLNAEKEELESKLWALAKNRPAEAAVDVKSLQAALPADAALIDFMEIQRETLQDDKQFVKSRGLVAFVIRKGAPVVIVDLGDAEIVTQMIDRWRFTTLGDKDQDPDQASAQQVAGQLRQRLWNPLEVQLNDVKTVLVVPEGPLGKLPLAALPGDEPDSYLIDQRAFVTIAAPGLLPELLARRDQPAEQDSSLLLVGNIDYGAAPGQLGETLVAAASDSRSWLPFQFRDLPGFGPEIADINASVGKRYAGGQVQLLERQAATEQTFRNAVAKRRFVHVATHGFFAPDVLESAARATPQVSLLGDDGKTAPAAATVSAEGLTSGLALAGANKVNEEGQDDGILSAMEVATLDLSGVEMAVLSACETGLGEAVGGESVVGLQRAFQVAGARTTVTSLWPVSDAATRLLMARFYRNLWNKDQPMSCLEALTEAQRWMLRAARAGAPSKGKEAVLTPDDKSLPFAFQWPTFWAAFVMCGDWR